MGTRLRTMGAQLAETVSDLTGRLAIKLRSGTPEQQVISRLRDTGIAVAAAPDDRQPITAARVGGGHNGGFEAVIAGSA